MSLHRWFFNLFFSPTYLVLDFRNLLMRQDIDGLLVSLPPVLADGLMFSFFKILPPNTRHCLLPETHAYYMPVMKIQYPLLRDTIWCSFACEVLGMACYLYYGVFFRVTQLSACPEAPGSWTNDDWDITEAFKNLYQLSIWFKPIC